MAGRLSGESTQDWLERIIGLGATDAQINGVREILAREGNRGPSTLYHPIASLELADVIVAKLDERDKTKKDVTVVISSATQTKVDSLFKQVGFHKKVYDGPVITPSGNFTPFDWGQRDEDTALPDACNHIEDELKKFGVLIGRGGYAVEDVHLNKNLLNVRDERVGAISGGIDVAIVPYKTAKSGIDTCICVLFAMRTSNNVSKYIDRLKHFEPQAQVELLASRCLSDQPGVLVVLSDLVSGAIIYSIEYDMVHEGFNVVEQEATLNEMGAIVAKFLAETAVPDVGYRPVEARRDPRDIPVIAFKKTKLSHDVGLALEHFSDMAEDTEPNSRERASLVEQLFRSMEVPRMPTMVLHSMYK
jgi:hypothetical protein